MNGTITCVEADKMRKGLHVWAARTNFVGGEVLDDRRPPDTYTEWCNDDKVVLLIEVLDADGCQHRKVHQDMKEDNDDS